jgi:hypothetical protein
MAAGSSQICDILGFLANLDRRQHARDRCWDMPKAIGAPKMRILLSSRRMSPVGFDRTHYNRTHYAADVSGGGRSSAMRRSMSENRFLGIATSAIWNAT